MQAVSVHTHVHEAAGVWGRVGGGEKRGHAKRQGWGQLSHIAILEGGATSISIFELGLPGHSERLFVKIMIEHVLFIVCYLNL